MDHANNTGYSPSKSIIVSYSQDLEDLEENIVAVRHFKAHTCTILHMVKGTGILSIGLHLYMLEAGDTIFLNNTDTITLKVSDDAAAYFCLILPLHFNDQPSPVLRYFSEYIHFRSNSAVVSSIQGESEWIRECFENMLREQHKHSQESQQALLLHLEMFLLYVKRIGKKATRTALIIPVLPDCRKN